MIEIKTVKVLESWTGLRFHIPLVAIKAAGFKKGDQVALCVDEGHPGTLFVKKVILGG